jgi:hypothetical protein
MNADDVTKLQVDAWKTTVEVQQHFNDIEMKIRAIAITLLTAILGAAALAVREGTMLHVAHKSFNLAAAILIIGFVTWVLFWFVDELWYHRLLLGAVAQGVTLEKLLAAKNVPGFGLTGAIGKASPFTINLVIRKFEVHSTSKIRLFYWGIAVLLAVAAITLALSDVNPAKSPERSHPGRPAWSR